MPTEYEYDIECEEIDNYLIEEENIYKNEIKNKQIYTAKKENKLK